MNRKEQTIFVSKYEYMPLFKIKDFEPSMKKQGVSIVSRTKGFLKRLKKVNGRYERMGYVSRNHYEKWLQRRENFIKRHLAQVEKRDESLYDVKGLPSRRTLMFYSWGFDPSPRDTRKARILLKKELKNAESTSI